MYKPKKFWKELKPQPVPEGTPRDKIIERIRKLKAVSIGRGASEAEAAVAAKHLHSLMDAHNVTLSELELKRDAAGCVNDYYMCATPEREEWHVALRSLGPLFHVKYWTSYSSDDLYGVGIEDEVTLYNFYGYPSDVEAAKSLAHIIHMGVIAEGAKFIALQGGRSAQKTAIRDKLPSFHLGIGERLGKLLLDLVKTSDSRALIPLKNQLVGQEFAKFLEEHGIRLGGGFGGGAPVHTDAYAAGQAAASNVNLGRGSVTGGPLRIGGK